jgi:hypothetical protein
MRILRLILISLLISLTACQEQSNTTQQAQALHFDKTIYLDGKAIQVAVFDTQTEREKGLMWVKDLPKDHGALFVFEQEAEVGFWMKNTLMPLDILFFNSQGELVKAVAEQKPCVKNNCPIITINDVKFVLELEAKTVNKQLFTAAKALQLRF